MCGVFNSVLGVVHLMASIFPVDEVICVGVVLKSRGFVVRKT